MPPLKLNRPLRRRRAKSLPGGIRLPDHRDASLRSRVMPTPLPETLILPLPADCTLILNQGDPVRKHQTLATLPDGVTPLVFAPTSGMIREIRAHPVLTRTKQQRRSVIIETDGEDRGDTLEPITDYRTETPAHVADRMIAAGVLNIGSSDTATVAGRQHCLHNGCRLLIINGIDGDPHASANTALIREYAGEVLAGANILQHATGAERCVFVMDRNSDAALDALKAVMSDSAVALMQLPSRYPFHVEPLLVQAVTGKRLSTHQTAENLGIMVLDAGTAYAAARATIAGETAIQRVVTVTGAGLITRKNFFAWLGTPVEHLLTLCGVNHDRLHALVAQGVMNGFPVAEPAAPVMADTACIIAAASEEVPEPPSEQACIRCGQCAQVCPVQLQPQVLYDFARQRDQSMLARYELDECIDCGACAYVCPSHIPLLQYFRAAREESQIETRRRRQARYWRQRFESHQARLKRGQEQALDQPDHSGEPLTGVNEEDDSRDFSRDFSRDTAQQEIAAAVARVQARRGSRSYTKDSDTQHSGDDNDKEA